jgi:hypothetical protein
MRSGSSRYSTVAAVPRTRCASYAGQDPNWSLPQFPGFCSSSPAESHLRVQHDGEVRPIEGRGAPSGLRRWVGSLAGAVIGSWLGANLVFGSLVRAGPKDPVARPDGSTTLEAGSRVARGALEDCHRFPLLRHPSLLESVTGESFSAYEAWEFLPRWVRASQDDPGISMITSGRHAASTVAEFSMNWASRWTWSSLLGWPSIRKSAGRTAKQRAGQRARRAVSGFRR